MKARDGPYRGTVVQSYDLTTCPSWAQVLNGPCSNAQDWLLVYRLVTESQTYQWYMQALTDNGCCAKNKRNKKLRIMEYISLQSRNTIFYTTQLYLIQYICCRTCLRCQYANMDLISTNPFRLYFSRHNKRTLFTHWSNRKDHMILHTFLQW